MGPNTLAFAFSTLMRPTRAQVGRSLFVPSTAARQPTQPDNARDDQEFKVVARRMPAIIRPVVPDPKLFDLAIEDRAQARSEILKKVNQYVKEKDLQDPTNKKRVILDAKLKALFGVDDCTILEFSKHITPYLRKPDDVGGRYVEEARLVEEQWEKEDAEAQKVGKTKRRSRKTAAEEKAQKDGRKIFKPVILSDELSAICRNQKELPRQQIVKAVWDYIRLNNLQGAKGEPIRCDFLLKKVFKADTITVKTIMSGIGPHVTKKED